MSKELCNPTNAAGNQSVLHPGFPARQSGPASPRSGFSLILM